MERTPGHDACVPVRQSLETPWGLQREPGARETRRGWVRHLGEPRMARDEQGRPPVALIIDDQEWSTRSLESILAPNGFAVMRAFTGRKGLERARLHLPDLVIADANLPDVDGESVCRALRTLPGFGHHIPVLLSSAERLTREQRLSALRAGVWDVINYPVDAEELVLRLGAYVRAKFESDRLRDAGLVDDGTGLYNLRGLQRRAEELSAWAYRERSAMACVVFAPGIPADEEEVQLPSAVDAVAKAIRAAGRSSDVIGRFGPTEFAVLAPSTDAAGAVQLAERIAAAVKAHMGNGDHEPFRFRAGYDAVGNARETPTTARDLLWHATLALRKPQPNGHGWLRAFQNTGA